MTTQFDTFADLGLSESLLKAIETLGFVSPSPIQAQTIPWMLQNRDVIALAQTGTGKTAAFGLPILQNLDKKCSDPVALILAPTRELAIQVGEHIESLGVNYRDASLVTVLCGGQDYRPQLKKLRSGTRIVVGTPGRVLDHIERGSLKLNALKTFVLDEADEMLRMGFIEDVEKVLESIPENKQIALFSATMPDRIRKIAKRYIKDPISVEIAAKTKTVQAINQLFLFASEGQKQNALLRLLEVESHQGVIVFVKTKTKTEEVARELIENGCNAMAIHGDISQSLREKIILQFKQGIIDVLVATDVAARGLDVERVSHVINYDMAQDCETYVHRIGRTGRAGRSGTTILFVTPRESRMLNIIERHTNAKITKMQIPSDDMVNQSRKERFLQNIQERMQSPELNDYKKLISKYIQDNAEASEIDVAAALALMVNNDKSLNVTLPPVVNHERRQEKSKSRSNSRTTNEPRRSNDTSKRFGENGRRDNNRRFSDNENSMLYRLDVGHKHGVKPGNIVGAIANESGINSQQITGLQIHEYHSTVKLPRDLTKEKVNALMRAWVCGRQLNLSAVNG
jgi:ATP-dependent RNA helicase DeaD